MSNKAASDGPTGHIPSRNDKKPRLHLLSGREITAENLAKMFKMLTGRDVSPGELEEGRKTLEEAYAKLNEGRKSATPHKHGGGEESN
jgi:hypothetical protein